MVNFEYWLPAQQDGVIKAEPGTYALILCCPSPVSIQVGRWRKIEIQAGYYVYVGSAFGPGGVRARVSRHLRADKPKHWHIDYLREFATPVAIWVSFELVRLEHRWAKAFYAMEEMSAIEGFGCSDCKCHSHLFYTSTIPNFSSNLS